MYETPKLNLIGDAREVILGSDGVGVDLDGTYFPSDWEYGSNGLPVPIPLPMPGL